MARTTTQAVQAILGADYDTLEEPDLTPYVETAAVLTAQMESCAEGRSYTHGAAQLEMIERWLAAHAYVCSDPTYLEKETQRARGKFMGTSGKGLEGSRYGQMAISLDGSGCLKSLNTQTRPQLLWLGLPPSEQTDYEDRD